VLDSFDGLGDGFKGPQSTQRPAFYRNPSDNSLAAGPNHIVQIVNARFAVRTRRARPRLDPRAAGCAAEK
jgi:hypothetical protein